MANPQIMKEFEDAQAILRGHFILSSGLRSDTYLQCARVLMDAKRAERLCATLAAKIEAAFGKDAFDLVVSPAMGGVVVGYEMGVGSGSMFKGGSPMGKATIGSTDIGDGMIMFQGMAYKDMGVAKRAREISAELRKQEPKAKHGDIAKKALEMALAEKGRV
jgi:hypothetical protein